ncbi:MAG: tetratricopeptide repeat protein [Pseudomonadota bacterium]|nr:tetratricopeptide repeat protein [Pseudomonadota bacterium]
MARRYHWGQALTAIGLVGALAACSTSMTGTRSASAVKVDPSKIGIAMKAQAALQANDLGTALSLGEAAVEYRPNDAAFRSLLGNIYLASGRYASAERSYHDALTLGAPDPQIVLKYALVQLAQGKTNDALAMLGEAQSLLDPADLGLALALAGRPADAVAMLEPAARARGADARVRQNLALAYALGGDWQAARTVAAQDLAADQVKARIAEWMAMARPGQASAQVASFIGIQPVASDPGQPVRLALVKSPSATRQAATDGPQPQPRPVAITAPVEPVLVEPAPGYAGTAPVAVAAALAQSEPEPAVEVAAMPEVRSVPREIADRAPRPALAPAAARVAPLLALRRNAALRTGGGQSRAVVQLGAYDSRSYIAGAWTRAASRHAALRDYTPVTARFDGAKGTFYRLSVKGFASNREAIDLCNSLKRAGAKCFVRAAYNDAPIQFASR